MYRTKKNWLVGVLIATGPILMGLTAAKDSIENFWPGVVPEIAWAIVPIIGLVCVLSGIVVWFVVRIQIPTLMPAYECYKAKKHELALIHELALKEFGSSVSSLPSMVKWFSENKDIFTVEYRVKRTRTTMSKSFVGYYCVIPISESAVKKLVSNEITGAGFISEHIVQANRDPYAVYLGGIAASGWLARGNLRSALHNEVFNHWAKKTRMAYTRPITQEGCRLIQKYNFTTVDPQNAGRMNSLYSRDLSHNNILRGNGLPYISSQ